MCGIVGTITRNQSESLATAMNAITHRGPDAGQETSHTVGSVNVQLGHQRLSIVDLSDAANQPLSTSCGSKTLVFNGEIYNHDALRKGLQSRGAQFQTSSDTEVLLNAYAEYGIVAFSQFNGMFAFAILDEQRNKLVLARDAFGIKPLYYTTLDDGGFAFASEIRALGLAAAKPVKPDPDCIGEFLLNGFLYEPNTGLQGISKLPAGHYLELDLQSLEFEIQRYHNPCETPASDGSLSAIMDAQIGLEVEADVAVGVFFSGGIDSTVLAVGAPREVGTLFVDYGEADSSELDNAKAIAAELGCKMQVASHDVEDLSVDAILEEFKSVAWGTEEPISDYTYTATRLISRLAREAGFKVMLSGMGGDELFAGYPRYRAAASWALLHKLRYLIKPMLPIARQVGSLAKRIERFASFTNASTFGRAYTSLVGYYSEQEVTQMLGSSQQLDGFYARLEGMLAEVKGATLQQQAMHLDRYGYLAHNLTVTDRASMAESIEVRVPLLTPAIEAKARSMTDAVLLHRGKGKLPLREYLYQRLPAKFIDRPKVGFNPPLDARIWKLGADVCRKELSDSPLFTYVDRPFVMQQIDDHFSGKKNNTYRIWQLLYLSMWLKSYQ